MEFRVAPSALQPIVLQGLAADTMFRFPNAARPERKGDDFVSYLPSDGAVKMAWKETPPEAEGKLFHALEMLSQISLSPGLMRQTARVDGKVMQGELTRLALAVRGDGEVTRVQGDQVLAWNVEPAPDAGERRLVVQFNQPQKVHYRFQVQMETALGGFPLTAAAMQLRPEGATRFAGYVRIVNNGAVRLEVAQASGLSSNSRKVTRPGRCLASRAPSGSPTGFPAPTSPCGSGPTKSCPNWPCRRCWLITSPKTNSPSTRRSNWMSAKRRCANC